MEFAVVLEPDEPLISARRAFFAGMNAIADAIAAHCPPERGVSFTWPGTILFDGGVLGGARLGWPLECAEEDVPSWLVFGVMLRAADLAYFEEGQIVPGMSLVGGGLELSETEAIIGSFARHLMAGFDQWNESGFSPIADAYLARLPKRKAGERRSIDRNGDLLVNMPAGGGVPDRTSFLGELARVAWYDPVLRGPKL